MLKKIREYIVNNWLKLFDFIVENEKYLIYIILSWYNFEKL